MSEQSQHLREGRVEFGQKLREARLQAGLSDVDLVHLTRISPQFIEALEKGEFQHLPGRVFGRGFVTNICKAIGGDDYELVEAYDRCWTEPPAIPPIVDKSRANKKPKNRFWKWFSSAVIVVIVAGYNYRTLLPDSWLTSKSPPAEQLSTAPTETPPPEEPAQAVPPELEEHPLDQQVEAAPPPIPVNKKAVRLEIASAITIRIKQDTGLMADMHLDPGTHDFDFKERLELIIPDPSDVNLEFAGEPFDLGKAKNRQHLVFSHNAPWANQPKT